MTQVQKSKEEFRELYKKYIYVKTGKWTKEDAEELERICKGIETKSTVIACVITGIIYAIIVGLVWLGFHLGGLI